ncbi:MAG: sodium:solute symporter family protein [Calditrichia bacterium]|nr:sodium:solute symporter family protein [Calditrichia bacterium]MCK5455077.1 sodium:solute symporter family protein [Calditrichia bacterium]
MHWYLYLILAYLFILLGFNFYRSFKVKTQDEMMVAGRSLSMRVMVFTLICTWIGSGTFIAGAEYAAKAGWSSLWLPAGAWVGIILIYFLAEKIRSFGKYTIGDILEVRYGKFARLFGALALIISFTAIVSYQFRAGGYILNIVSKGAISVELGQTITAAFVILFTAAAGMMAVAYTDLPNGIIILSASILAAPVMYFVAGGWEAAVQTLPEQHFAVFNKDFGAYPLLKAGSYFLATMFLLLGVQSMYQKFYSAKTPKDARQAVAVWVVGTIVVETVVVVIAVFAASYYWEPIKEFEILSRVKSQVISREISIEQIQPTLENLINQELESGNINGIQKIRIENDLNLSEGIENEERLDQLMKEKSIDPASIVLVAAQTIVDQGGFLVIIGLLLLAAAVAVVISTGMNYLLSPTTNIMRDVYQRFINPDATQKNMVVIQKVMIVILGLIALYFATNLTSVLEMSFFAYTIYGVAITPALIAALAWKRATRLGGLISIIGGALVTILLKLAGYVWPSIMIPAGDPNGDPWGIPLIYPALAFSILSLVIFSYLSKAPTEDELKEMFPKKP